MTSKSFPSRPRTTGLISWAAALLLVGCASGPSVTISQPLSEGADTPYKNVLVVALFSSFDPRRYLETEIVNELEKLGVKATASTSMMDSRTPVVPQTFIDMVERIGADGLVLTQLASLDTTQKDVATRPQATLNYWPTYYFNVFEVELTEYVEPPRRNLEHELVLASQVFSVRDRAPVWGIDSRSSFTQIEEDGLRYSVFVDEARAIVRRMARDGLVRGQ